MEWLSELYRRMSFFSRRSRLDRELAEEMRVHIEMAAEENQDEGLEASEARYAALRQFGNATLLREQSREVWGWKWLEQIIRDLRFALRMMAKSPVFTSVAIISLALGIGLNTSIFNIVDGLLLRSAPGADARRLVVLYLYEAGRPSGSLDGLSTADYESYVEGAGVFDSLAAHSSMAFSVRVNGFTENLTGELVSDNYFSTLRVAPRLGRFFVPGSPGIVVSYGFWQRRLGGDPAAVGKTLTIAGTALPVIGIAPSGFHGLQAGAAEPPGMWVPFALHEVAAPAWRDRGRGMHWWETVGRLKSGTTHAQAQAAVFTVSARLARDYPKTNRNWRAGLVPLDEALRMKRGPLVNVLAVLSVIAGIVLLITCANLANLLLARGWKRSHEMALRISLGATRGRLLAQLLTESGLLALIGGAVGWIVSIWGSEILGHFFLPFRSGAEDAPDAQLLLFSLAVSVLTGILFGVAPARQGSRVDLSAAMKTGLAGLRGRHGMRNALITAQVSLSLLLLIGAGLFLKTLGNAYSSDVTLAARNVLLAHFDLATQRYTTEASNRFWPRLLESVRALPGVRSASLVMVVPYAGRRGGGDVVFGQQRIQVDFNSVAPDYFQTIGIPLVRGRDFNDRDAADAPPRVIVNEEFARRFWPGEDPVRKTVRLTYPSAFAEVVGLVRDGKFRGFRAQVQPCCYRPLYQEAGVSDLTLEVKAAGRADALVPALREAVAALDPDLPLKDIRTWQDHVGRSVAQESMLATLLSGFGLLALLLASIGTYGVVSFGVAQRTREIGIRIALGAGRAKILREVLGGVMVPVGAGIVLGAAGALMLTRFVKSLLYGVSATDFTVFSAVIMAEITLALAAGYLPGRRAMKVDPVEALRYE